MDNFQEKPDRIDGKDESSSDSDDYSHSDNDDSDSCRDSSSSNSDITCSSDDTTDSDDESEGVFVSHTVDHEKDPNIGSVYGPYRVVARNQASYLFRVINRNASDIELTATIIRNGSKPEFLTKYQLVEAFDVNKIFEIVTEQEKSLVVYQETHRNLHEYVCLKKHLPEVEVAKLFQQICKIMADVHSVGIIVRDLKARKFVFVDPGSKKLVLETLEDAILLDNPEDDTLISKLGCPTYASPELLITREVKYSGKMADCWSLGVILFALLTNRYPFFDLNMDSMFTKIRKGKFRKPENRSHLSYSLVKALLNVDVKTRVTAAEALKHEWFRVFCQSESIVRPSASMSFGSLNIIGFTQNDDEIPSFHANIPRNIDLSSPSTSGYTFQMAIQEAIEPQESNIVPYPVYSRDQCVPSIHEDDIENSSIVEPQNPRSRE